MKYDERAFADQVIRDIDSEMPLELVIDWAILNDLFIAKGLTPMEIDAKRSEYISENRGKI